jgi:hypothetical protein
MKDTYRHRSLLGSLEYRLTDEGVAVTERRIGRFTRALVPYDKIPLRSTTATWSSRWLFWIGVVSAVLFVAMIVGRSQGKDIEPGATLFYGLLCTVVTGAWWATRRTSEVFLFENDYLALRRRRSSDAELSEFIDSMQKEKLAFLETRIARRVPEVPSGEAARYVLYLRESGLIDEAAYEQLRAFVADRYSSESAGFK